MERRERTVVFESREHLRIDKDRTIVIGSAVHHPMTDGARIYAQLIPQPCSRRLQRRGDAGYNLGPVLTIDKRVPIGGARAQPRTRTDSVYLAFDLARQISGRLKREDLEFEAGRAGVDYKDGIH